MRSSDLFGESPSFSRSNTTKKGGTETFENQEKKVVGGGFSSSFNSSNVANGGDVIREEKTAMGEKYVVNEFGEKIIPQSKRPDGSYRKPIKVKPGYIPMEEQRSYRTRVQENRIKIAEKHASHPPGWSPLNNDTQANTSKQKKKKKQNNESYANEKMNNSSSSVNNNEEDEDVLKLGVKIKTNLNLNEKGEEKEEEKKENNLTSGDLSSSTDVSKRVRNLRKKLNEIKDLEEKQCGGDTLSVDQINKINRKRIIEEEMKMLEELIANKTD